jgi:arylsulfatase A-like enzyme
MFESIKNNKVKVFSAVLIAALAAVFSLIYLLLPGDEDIDKVKENAKRLLARSQTLYKRAQTFKQAEVLKSIGKSPVNGYYYRFDDHLDKAKIDLSTLKSPAEPDISNIEFAEKERIQFQSKGEKFSVGNGILRIDHQAGAYFETDVDIPFDDVGEIEIKAKHKKGKLLRFGWSWRRQAKNPWRGARFIDVDVIPRNKFYIYTIKMEELPRKRPVQKLYLSASDKEGDIVEIDYIRFISKKARYLRRPMGTAYETIRNEMRKVLFSQTPLSITYELETPGNSFLTFGMGIIEENNPVTFEVLIDGGNTIFSRKIISAGRWEDARIDMSSYAGQRIQITFKTGSSQNNIAFWSNPILYTPAIEKFNIIIVLEDALRADHMSCYGYHRPTTPVKNIFAKKGILFLNSFAQATKTRPSCPATMTSLYPTATGVWKYFERLHENYLTLAEILRHAGFRTASFIENGNAGPASGLHQGFSNLYKIFGQNNKTRNLYGRQVIDWIKKQNESNCFLYLHLTDPHGPYDPPENNRHWYNESTSNKNGRTSSTTKEDRRGRNKIELAVNGEFDPSWITSPTQAGRRARYDDEIRNNDFYFEGFLNNLKELNLLEHTLIIFISDHGEHLGEHNLWGHHPPGFIQVIKTPMIMVYPKKLPRNLVITEPVQNIDILPTILELAGIDNKNLLLAGDSLLPLIYGKKTDFWNNRIIVSDEVHYRKARNDRRALASIIYNGTHILSSDKHPMRRFDYLFDKEETAGAALPPGLKEYWKSFIRKLQANNFAIWQTITKNKPGKIKYNPKTIKHLKSLGYVQ